MHPFHCPTVVQNIPVYCVLSQKCLSSSVAEPEPVERQLFPGAGAEMLGPAPVM
jgi:hypothetical protein